MLLIVLFYATKKYIIQVSLAIVFSEFLLGPDKYIPFLININCVLFSTKHFPPMLLVCMLWYPH